MEVNIPIVEYDIFPEEDRNLIQEVKCTECLESLDYPKIRRASVSKPEIELEVIPHEHKNLIDGPIHEYFAFVLILSAAIVRYANNKFGRGMTSPHFLTTGRAPFVPNVQEIENLPQLMAMSSSNVGKVIAYAFRSGPEETKRLMDVFNTRVFRFQVLEALWKQAASSAEWFNLYMETKLMQTASMIRHLGHIAASWRRNTKYLDQFRKDPHSVSSMCAIANYPNDEWHLNSQREAGNEDPGRLVRGGYVIRNTQPTLNVGTMTARARPATRNRRNNNLVLERIVANDQVAAHLANDEAPQVTQYVVYTGSEQSSGNYYQINLADAEVAAAQQIAGEALSIHVEESDEE